MASTLQYQAYSKFSDTTQTYLNIINNFKETYITGVKQQATACDSGYESLFEWDWGGTSAGCDCGASSYASSYKVMSLNSCNSTQISKGCKTASAVSAKLFQFIQGANSVSPMNVCVKRADSSKAFYKVAKSQMGVCTSSQKTCGNPANKETIFCVGSTEDCPIYAFAVSPTPDIVTYPPSEWSSITLLNTKILYYNQKGLTAKGLPNSELRFTQGDGVCSTDNTGKKLPSGQSDYVLMKSKRVSCSSTDPSFLNFGFQVEENLYYNLNLDASTLTQMNTWTGLQIYTSTSLFKSFQRPFISWKISERQKLFDFVDSADTISNLKSAQLVVMIINIIVCLAVSVFLNISMVYNLMGKDVPCIDGVGDEEKVRIVRIKKILTYGSKLLQLPFLLWALIASAQKKGILRDVANGKPSDDMFNSQIESFTVLLEDNVFKKNLIAIIILGITLLLDILLYIRGRCKSQTPSNQVQPAKVDEEVKFQQNQQQPTPTPNQQQQQQDQYQYQQQLQQQQQYQMVQQPVYGVQQPTVIMMQQPGVMVQPMYVQQGQMVMQPGVVVMQQQY